MAERSDGPHISGSWCVNDGVGFVANNLSENDARLIAAAPELLSALEDAAFLLHKLGTNWKEAASMKDSCLRSSNDALAAIAKAKGGAS